MKILLSWLNDYIETNLEAVRIAEILSDLGFPCEGIEQLEDDFVIDAEVTSNRGDCLGYIGIARELAAATGCELKIPAIELDESDKDVTEFVDVQINEPELCGRYTARIIYDVKVGPSPDWLMKRLEAVGMRSVNNVVDVTNYTMLETGQPPHAFDYDKITNDKIIVRKATAGERLTSIDGSQCELTADMLVIADTKGPVAIAGVMGGLDTEISDATTKILLEDAYFDPVCVRSTSRRLALPSEASFRFERIVDIEKIDWASQRTAQLIAQVSGGKIAKGVVDDYPKKIVKKEVSLRFSRLNKLLGIEISPAAVEQILSSLCFEPKINGDSVVCSVPSWRSDVCREADLIEEVARVHGYNKIPTERKIKIEVVPVGTRQKLTESIGTYLNSCGFYETINISFVEQSTAGLFSEASEQRHLAVRDDSRKSANMLRQALIGSLLSVLKTNVNAKNLPCRIFEIADTFIPSKEDGLPIENAKLTLVCDSDFRELRGVIEGLIKSIDSQSQIQFEPVELLWAKTGAQIIVNSRKIGTAGIISQTVRGKYDFTELWPCAAEIEFESLLALQKNIIKLKPIPRFPAIQRDLSIIVEEQIRWADIIEAIQKKASVELQDVQFIEIYRGKGIPSGKKSITISLCFRDEEGTLTHETVDNFQKEIVNSLSESINAELRTV